jgi:hypothetical protein
MILVRSRKIEARLADGSFSEWDKAKYYLLSSIISPIGIALAIGGQALKHQLTPIEQVIKWAAAIIEVLIVYNGFKRCFQENKRSDNSNFIERMVILMVPVTIKVVCAIFIAVLAFTTVAIVVSFIRMDMGLAAMNIPWTVTYVVAVVSSFLVPILTYSLLLKAIKRIAFRNESTIPN